MRGFKNFLMRGDVIVVAIGLVVALAFSMLISAFTTYIINPIVASFEGGSINGLGVQLGKDHNPKTFLDFGSFISAIIYFVIFVVVVYSVIVVPYKHIQGVINELAPRPGAGKRCSAIRRMSRPAPRACPATSRPPPPSASTAAPTSPPWPPELKPD